jgi:putative tryptophan/tyrosine transport system substrate-binding protein
VLRNPDDKALDPVYWREITEAAQRLGVALRPVLAPGARDLEAAFAEMAREGCQELVEMPNSALSAARTRIIDLAAKYRIAAIYDTREFVEVGGLMSYGPDLSDLYRRAADYVDKILKGAKPAELPIQQPDKFELVVNLKTAKALGVTIPPTILARADEVIE